MDEAEFTLTEEELPDVSVELTPRPVAGSASVGQRSLDGTWLFAAGPAETPPDDATWRRHDVPGQWNIEGHDVDDDQRGWYRREFALPGAWASGPVKLRFDAVYSDAVVFLNGERVGAHEGGYTPFELDVTDAVDVGDNILTVGVAEQSDAGRMGQRSLGGGITRSVTLVSVPPCHLADVDLQTTLADDHATISVAALVANAAAENPDVARVRVSVTAPDGTEAATVERAVDRLPAGTELTVSIDVDLEEFVTWNPEQPRLYDVAVDLVADAERERVTQSVGLRELAVEGDSLLLNGRAVTLRGVNWRECHPDYGLAIPPELTRRDAERLRAANVNYVRTGHHPTSEAFVEACDELGIVVEMEAPIAFLRFDNSHLAADPAYRDLLCRQTLEIVERDKNRTSVGIWSLSNESDWGPNFEAAARLVKRADPTRPTTFNWGMYLDHDEPFVDVANHHYPALRDSLVDLEAFEEIDRPVLFGEFAHLYCSNVRELGTDPGLRDQYGHVFERAWERVREIDAFAGAAIWAGLDHLYPEYRWGLVDKYRRPRPEYWHVKNAYAPVDLVSEEWGDELRVELRNDSEFVDLSERRVEWTAGGESGVLDVSAPPGDSAVATVPVPAGVDAATLEVTHPLGFVIAEFSLRPEPERVPPERSPSEQSVGDAADYSVTTGETQVRFETDAASLTVDRNVGELLFENQDGDPLVSGLLGVAAGGQEPATFRPLLYQGTLSGALDPWRCEAVHVADDAPEVVVEGGYYYDTIDLASGAFTLRLLADGILAVEYEFTLSAEQTVRETGLVVPVVDECDTLSWSRDARLGTYPDDHIGRAVGTAAAFPDGSRPTDEVARLDRSRIWAHDVTSHGSNDFRSTKRNVRRASLTAADERTLAVLPPAENHVRCSVEDGRIDVFVLDRSLSGVGLGLLDRHALVGEEPVLPAGTALRGSVRLSPR